MLERIAKTLAVLGLGLAIGAVVMAVRATLRAGAIQGPVALAVVTSTQEVWLGVDQALWRVAPDGRLRDVQAVAALGLPGAPANLVRGPAGHIVASVRNDATLYVLDAGTARVVRTLRPQWPADLERHAGRAINLAFAADGRFAVATGGGHAVALFAADGAFLARTPPGRYDFSNGLWWRAEGLWTTDTNRFTLRRLDAATLDERRAVDLGQTAGGSFLGPARGHPAADGTPMAALIRYRGDMTEGGVALIGADARPTALPHADPMEPRDLDWLGDHLLVTDGASFSVLRWTAEGRAASPFGDDALQQRLGALVRERDGLRAAHGRWLAVAALALVLGIACAAAAPRLARSGAPPPALDLSKLGTPRVGRMVLLKLHARASAWMVVPLVPVLMLQFVPTGTRKAMLGQTPPAVLVGAAVLLLAATVLALSLWIRRLKRLAARPEFEPFFNQRAMLLLRRRAPALAATLRDGEQVLEAFAPAPGVQWCVLTGERLLCFSAALFEPRLMAAHALADVAAVSTKPGGLGTPSGWRAWGSGSAWIEIAFDAAPPLRGSVGSAVLAARVAERLLALSTAARAARARLRASPPAVSRSDREAFESRRRVRALASALVPGLGQWLQRRSAAAIAFLTVWVAGLVFFTGPLLWTLIEPFTGVTPMYVIGVVLGHLGWHAAAAAEAWHGEPAPMPRQRSG